MNSATWIRRYEPATDSVTDVTALLHRAYKRLAEAGMRYLASHQDDETTQSRMESGTTFVAVYNGDIAGVVSLYGPTPGSPCVFYRRDDVWHFGQFAVAPERQGQGIGVALLEVVEEEARRQGAVELALDTSERAAELIAFYKSRGFREVGEVEWSGITNYRSVVLSKVLNAAVAVAARAETQKQ